MALQTAELERVKEQIRGLGRRDWLWWSLGLLSLLLVGGGLMHLFLRRAPDAAARPVELTLGQAVAYLYAVAVVVVAFQIYSLLRSKESRKVQVELLLETLKNEVGRLESLRDPMTQVYNRNCLDELLAMEIKRSQRYTKPFAVILMDIDNFKGINDRFGHLKGDYVLMEVAQILRTCVRGADYIIRYGGDEFIMLLPDTDQEGAEIVVERLQKKITDWDTRSEDGRFELTISAGISIFTQGREAAELVTEADQRMYEAKRSRASASSTQATP